MLFRLVICSKALLKKTMANLGTGGFQANPLAALILWSLDTPFLIDWRGTAFRLHFLMIPKLPKFHIWSVMMLLMINKAIILIRIFVNTALQMFVHVSNYTYYTLCQLFCCVCFCLWIDCKKYYKYCLAKKVVVQFVDINLFSLPSASEALLICL